MGAGPAQFGHCGHQQCAEGLTAAASDRMRLSRLIEADRRRDKQSFRARRHIPPAGIQFHVQGRYTRRTILAGGGGCASSPTENDGC
jgi:hypothetical protein